MLQLINGMNFQFNPYLSSRLSKNQTEVDSGMSNTFSVISCSETVTDLNQSYFFTWLMHFWNTNGIDCTWKCTSFFIWFYLVDFSGRWMHEFLNKCSFDRETIIVIRKYYKCRLKKYHLFYGLFYNLPYGDASDQNDHLS